MLIEPLHPQPDSRFFQLLQPLVPLFDARLTSDALNVFIRALFGELRRRAHELLGVRSSQCGVVTFVQRWGNALNCNPHFHCLAIDGVYAASGDGHPEFHQLPPPEDEDN